MSPLSRRDLLRLAGATLPVLSVRRRSAEPLKPARLLRGDTVGLVSPASASFDAFDLRLATERLEALGLKARAGAHVLDRRGYLAGMDEDRAADINAMFADPEVDAILALRGGWGSARLLPLLDYTLIAQNPKLFIGFSDITSLLLAIYARSGLVTIHGPDGLVEWNAFSIGYFRKMLFDGERVRMENPMETGDDLIQTEDRVRTITAGTATGRLAGGNLTVLTAILGSPYLPEWEGHLLFLEDVGEDIYRVDRMLTQLKLAGVLDSIAGFVFGKCTRCEVDSEGYGSLTLHEVLADHIAPLGIPAYSGAMIGHIPHKFTVPIGTRAELDATKGTITLLEPVVL